MYTQCPDCGTSFRVTAVALKQAAGKVRCGGCGNAFNALAYLSEDKPDRTVRTEVDESLPELIPDDAEVRFDGPPAAISPEQSAALLKTLDQLAGEDIRLEDTGVEWRVLGPDEVDNSRVDDLLHKRPTQVDEFLTKTPTEVEAGEIFEDANATEIDAAEVFGAVEETAAEEMRFDDNTGLPDDFAVDDLPTPPGKAKLEPETEPEPKREPEPENSQVDLALGDPDEWGDLLDEVEEPEEVDEVEEAKEPEVVEEAEEVAAAADENDAAAEPELEDEDAEDLIEDFEETAEIDLDEHLDGEYDEDIEKLEIRLDDETEEQEDVADESDTSDSIAEHYVPPQTEEEQTINMMIDKDLFDLAIEDEDGFASTIVIGDMKIEEKGIDEKKGGEPNLKETAAGFETIIMEGEFVRAAGDGATGNGLSDPGFVLAKEVLQEEPELSSRKYGMIAGIVVLALLLIGQIVHQSRAALATMPAIGERLAPVYRAIGAPISPDWDISGWRFEVTKGSTNPIAEFLNGENELTDVDAVDDSPDLLTAEDETLTIYSRIGNNSDGPLPYPLISVALTDRFEEIIGSKVLEPNAYLTGNFDPRVAVLPGDTFNAVISIESPSPEATGFKLNVCYRQAGGLLRCAMEDFK